MQSQEGRGGEFWKQEVMVRAKLDEIQSVVTSSSIFLDKGLTYLHSVRSQIDQLRKDMDAFSSRNSGETESQISCSKCSRIQTKAFVSCGSDGLCTVTPAGGSSFNRSTVAPLSRGPKINFQGVHPSASGGPSKPYGSRAPPQPKLQARVNPMVQGVPLMCPSISLQRLQPNELERQMGISSRATTARTPISSSLEEQASLPDDNSESTNSARNINSSTFPDEATGSLLVVRRDRQSRQLRRSARSKTSVQRYGEWLE